MQRGGALSDGTMSRCAAQVHHMHAAAQVQNGLIVKAAATHAAHVPRVTHVARLLLLKAAPSAAFERKQAAALPSPSLQNMVPMLALHHPSHAMPPPP